MANSPINPKKPNGSRLKTLIGINDFAANLLKQKKKRVRLESKYQQVQDKLSERRKLSDKEKRQESKKDLSLKGKLGKNIQKTQLGIGGFFFGILKAIVAYKAVEWASKPENLKAVQGLAKGFINLFKFFNFFVGGSIDNALSGIHDLLFGGTILERFVGLFRGIIGIIGLFTLRRYVKNPLKLIKDLNFVIKNSGKILDIFKAFATSGIKGGADALVKGLSKSAGLFKHGLTRGLARGFLSIFGKGGVKLLSRLFTPLKNIALGMFKAGAKRTVAGIPVVGPLIDLGLNLLFGDPLDKALFKAAGSTLGMSLGGLLMGALGSVIPGAGTVAGAAAGAAAGGLAGDWAASKLYDMFKSKKSDVPELAVGGIVTRPTTAMIGEAGPEAVIPLASIFSGGILQGPLSVIGASMIGGVNALLMSMGPVGNLVRPFASQLFASYVRDYGVKNFTFSSDLGKKSAKSLDMNKMSKDDSELSKVIGTSGIRLIKTKDSKPKTRYNSGNTIREILADIFNNVMNLESTTTATKSGTQPSDKDALDASGVPGSDHQEKAFNYFIKLGLSKEHAAGIVGNLMIESYTDIRPNADNGSHRGIAQWDKQHRWPTLVAWANNKNKDPNKFETQLEYLSIESGYLRKFKSTSVSSVDHATQEWEELFERSGGQALDTRKKYARSVLQKYAKMQTGGMVSRGDITSQFSNKESFRKKPHEGVDIGFSSGTPLSFALGGKFIAVGRTSSKERESNGGYGQYMDVQLSDGKIARLAHLSSIPSWVQQGKEFNPNTIIALSGGIPGAAGSGRSGGAHLHLEQHTTKKDLAETLNGKVDPLKSGIFSLLRKGGSSETKSESPSATSPSTTTVPETKPEESLSLEAANKIATMLGQLYKGLGGVPKTDINGLWAKSMDLVQSRKQLPFMSDIYMITPSSTVMNNLNVLMPLPSDQPDVLNNSFANLDSPSFIQRRL
jgi:murein DD-endopeptidase MepM/ murein hydrolase activator NlpD